MPRRDEGLGTECVLDLPVDNLQGKSFQELFTRLPIKLRGFGLRSMVDTSPAAFIGGIEMALGGEEAEEGWWRDLLGEGSRTGNEYAASWSDLQREGEQMAAFLGQERAAARDTTLQVVGRRQAYHTVNRAPHPRCRHAAHGHGWGGMPQC